VTAASGAKSAADKRRGSAPGAGPARA